jgi:hypothetical protein
MVLLCTLQEFYNNLIVTLESQSDTNLDIEFVTTRFFHEKLKDNECSIEGGPTLVSCILSQPHFEGSVRSPLTFPKMGV